MEFLHKKAQLLLRISLGINFFWFGILKLFNSSPVLYILNKAFPAMGSSQLFIFILAIIEILIGLAFLSNKFIKIASIIMIISLLVVSVPIFVSQGFYPRFPVLSLAGEYVIKNLVLIAAGLVLIANPTVASGQEKDKTKP